MKQFCIYMLIQGTEKHIVHVLKDGAQTFAHKTIAHKTVAHKTIAHKTIAHNLNGK